MQIYGGHGYIKEHGMEQLVRDIRIAPIYEGTNAVQAIDLVLRKLIMKEGKVIESYLAHIDKEINKFNSNNNLKEFCLSLKKYNKTLKELTSWIQDNLKTNQDAVNAAATEYLNILSSDRLITTLNPSYTYGFSQINTHLANGASIILNNNSHDSVGGQSTYANSINFEKLSKSGRWQK